ncbi:MAG: plasmid pRiA4b ORF-3 family protein, partial [Patescibacteria group bacterium]|nr:plasmid pRiA4b ORF-3 family protein [Patescibacteria group bacterium]
DEEVAVDSLDTRVSHIVPKDGKPFRFDYEYDFGDRWQHEILFEGCLRAGKGVRYPLCVEGERACPPEDVGGICGYAEHLAILSNPDHKEWEETSDWRGPYRPEHFNAIAATKAMRRGLPNWRRMD